MKILITNWITILGVFLIAFTSVFCSAFFFHSATFIQAVFGAFLSVCLYGMMFWGLFVVSLVVLDILLIVWDQKHLRQKLLIEWLLVSSPFIYWTIKYQEWIFLVSVLAFLVTQLLREKLIVKATQP